MSFLTPAQTGLIKQSVHDTVSSLGQARVSSRAARAAREDAAAQAATQRRQAARTIGARRARFLAGGLGLDGAPQEALDDLARESELDALSTIHRGERAAQLHKYAARKHRADAFYHFVVK